VGLTPGRARWKAGEAWAWWEQQPWPAGVNFIPSTACNQLEMWQADTFDPSTIERELSWAADLGFNTARTYLHDLLWADDPDGFIGRVDTFLRIAHSSGIRAILVLFDDVWNVEFGLGPQSDPYPGRHNSQWVQSPGLHALESYYDHRARLKTYVRGLLGAFVEDDRVLAWDLYNEPGGVAAPSGRPVDALCLPLLADVFDWARSVDPCQPLTSGTFTIAHAQDPRIRALQLAASDIVSFHHYGGAGDLERVIESLATRTARPLLCTEYLARTEGSRFETHLPVFQRHHVGAVSWGLVAGRTQTQYPWSSWLDADPYPEPDVWFHDILRADGTPYSHEETAFLRTVLRS
jgi:cellulase (glycosyl hydrolase family 5)